jgi:glycine cleavage system H protein
MNTIEGLKYSNDHEWVKVDGKMAYIGITDYAQHSLGDIVFVDLPGIGSKLNKGEILGVVESVKAASDVYMPADGTVVKINETIIDDPALLNKDAFENWMIYVELNDPEELKQLMSTAEYIEFCSK